MATRRFYIANGAKNDIQFLSEPIGPNKDSCNAGFMDDDKMSTDLLQFMLMNTESIFQPISAQLRCVSYSNGTITW